MHKSQFTKIDAYDWFCGPGSHIYVCFIFNLFKQNIIVLYQPHTHSHIYIHILYIIIFFSDSVLTWLLNLSPDILTNCETFYINLWYRGACFGYLFQGICIFFSMFEFKLKYKNCFKHIHSFLYFPALGVVHSFIFGGLCVRLGFRVWLQQLHLLFFILSLRLHRADLPFSQTVSLGCLWLLVSLPAAVQPAGERLLHHQSQPRHGQLQHVQEHPGEWETLWEIDREI